MSNVGPHYKYLSKQVIAYKTKDSRINKHKKKFKIDNLHFLSYNILTRLLKDLKNI